VSTSGLVPSAQTAKPRPYHHGDLRNALVDAGVALAREGGPQAVVLREAARRVGVSPNAAYRHFEALPDLVEAVAYRALLALADAMRAELDRRRPTGEAQHDAWDSMVRVGRAYVHFALREPGLFAAAFNYTGELTPPTAEPEPDRPGPWVLLIQALEGLVTAGLLDGKDIEAAAATAWSTVHGLSLLLLGPMGDLKKAERERVVDATLAQIGTGLLRRP
jgi:AcrR family transcriptional regulator